MTGQDRDQHSDTPPEAQRRVARLVFVAAERLGSGIGEHADRLLPALASHADEVIAIRTPLPGRASVRDCLRIRREVTRALTVPGAVLHVELGGGDVAAFWSVAGRRTAVVTAVIHDPPRPVWFPLRFALVGRHRLVSAALNLVLTRPLAPLERWGVRRANLVALTDRGAQQLADGRYGSRVLAGRLVGEHPVVARPVTDRPLAVGLFGVNYRARGFDLLDQLRAGLDPRIEIVVAGYGTETIPSRPGVRVLGAVQGDAQSAFLQGVRLMLLPYRRKRLGGQLPAPASSSFATAAGHHTPSLSVAGVGLDALRGSGCELVTDVDELATRANTLIFDEPRLAELSAAAAAFSARQTTQRAVDPIVAQWWSA